MSWRVAILGLGAAARNIHLPACRNLRNVAVVGGFDPQFAPGAPAAADLPVPIFATAEELLDRARPDLVIVAAPPERHGALVELSLQAGCHVLCEKPFVGSLEEADRLIALAGQVGRRVVVNQEYRFMQIHQAARERIGTSDFGELLFLHAAQTFRTSAESEAGWRGASPQRTCREFGIHVLDLCRFFFDEEPIAISAQMQSRPSIESGSGPDLVNLITLEFSAGRLAHITLDRLTRGRHRYLDLRLNGTLGTIETQIGGRAVVSAGIRGGTRRPFIDWHFALGGSACLYHGEQRRVIARDPLNLFAAATASLLQATFDALDRGELPPCGAQDNRRSLRLMFAAYQSAAEHGRRIQLIDEIAD